MRNAIRSVAGVAFSILASCGAPPPSNGPVRGTRVISLVPSITDFALAIGGGPNLVARTDYDTDSRIRQLPSVGGPTNPNLEVIAPLHPDLVIAWDDSTAPGLLGKLHGLRIPLLTMRAATLADARGDIERLGVILGNRRAADSLRRAIDESLHVIASTHDSRAPRPRVFYLVWRRPLITTGRGTFIDALISIAGGRNVFGDLAQAWPTVSLEALARRGVDLIVVPTSSALSVRDVVGDPQLRALLATTRARVVPIDGDLMSRPGPRVGEAARALANVLR